MWARLSAPAPSRDRWRLRAPIVGGGSGLRRLSSAVAPSRDRRRRPRVAIVSAGSGLLSSAHCGRIRAPEPPPSASARGGARGVFEGPCVSATFQTSSQAARAPAADREAELRSCEQGFQQPVAPLCNTQCHLNSCRGQRHLLRTDPPKKSQPCNRMINTFHSIRSTVGHKCSPATRGSWRPCRCSSGPRRARLCVLDLGPKTLRGRMYLRRAWASRARSPSRQCSTLQTNVGRGHPLHHSHIGRMARVNGLDCFFLEQGRS